MPCSYDATTKITFSFYSSNLSNSTTATPIPVYPEIYNLGCLGKFSNFGGNNTLFYTNYILFFIVFVTNFILINTLLSAKFTKNLFLLFTINLISQVIVLSKFYPINTLGNALLIVSLNFLFFKFLNSIFTKRFAEIDYKYIILFLLISGTLKFQLVKFYFIPLAFIINYYFAKLLSKHIPKLKDSEINLSLLSLIGPSLGNFFGSFRGNQIGYLPSVINSLNGELSVDFVSNITFPYFMFKQFTILIFQIFSVGSLDFLNFFSSSLCYLFIFIFIKEFFNKYNISIIFVFITLSYKSLLVELFKFIDFKYMNYISNLLTNGIGDSVIFTNYFQPTVFDGLILLALVLFTNNKPRPAFVLMGISVLMHSFNIVPTGVLFLVYFFKELKISNIKKIMINSAFYIFSSFFFLIFNLLNFTDELTKIIKSDQILTYSRIPEHRLFNGGISLFGNTDSEIILGDSITTSLGFTYPLEFIILFFSLVYFFKKKFLVHYSLSIFVLINFTLIKVYYFPSNIDSFIRNVVPWRMSSFIFLLGCLCLINLIVKKIDNNKINIFALSIFSFFLIFNNQIDNKLNVYENEASPSLTKELNLTHRFDYYIQFRKIKLNENYNFLPTTGNYYAHPYQPSEIVNWWSEHQTIDTFFNSNPSCDEAKILLTRFNAKRFLFSSSIYVPESLKQCKEYKFLQEYNYYSLEFNEN